MAKLMRVFVYGTLKIGEPNHHWLTNPKNGFAKLIGPAKTTCEYPLVIGTRYNIPFLLDLQGSGRYVKGEIYEIDENMLAKLDVLEDYPNFYHREIQPVKSDANDEIIPCWIYLLKIFPDKMLQLPMLDTYTNAPPTLYCERSRRMQIISAKDDLWMSE